MSSNSSNSTPYSLNTESYGYERNDPLLPLHGTKNWKKLARGSSIFSPRHSHATCVYKCPNRNGKDCIWLTGGRSEPYRTFNLKYEDRNADVWWTEDGSNWNKVMKIEGDFIDGVGNFDAKHGGEVAPWYSRYGHSLDPLDANGDGVADAMVLTGGFQPSPSNDVWISVNGSVWNFDGYAPWPARAYHATAVFQGKLWIMGGSPLSNDVWVGRLVRDPSKAAGYKVAWSMQVKNQEAPWAPRAGFCATTQLRRDSAVPEEASGNTVYTEYMYIIGGYAGWPREDRRHNGERCRNDVWVTTNGTAWERAMPPPGMTTMPFGARAWHGCTTWHSFNDPSLGVSIAARDASTIVEGDDKSSSVDPKIYIMGGGYTGTKGNNVVRKLEGYVDAWWSYDGSIWNRIDYEEGYKDNLYSTNEWSMTNVDGHIVHLGKWGHSLVPFRSTVDLNMDGEINDTGDVVVEICGHLQNKTTTCKQMIAREDNIPAMFVIGGDTVDSGPIVQDVFSSTPGVLCEINGVTCSGRGYCGPGMLGCVCDSDLFTGEYCNIFNESYYSAALSVKSNNPSWLMYCGLFIFFQGLLF